MARQTRRKFLKTSLLAAGAGATFTIAGTKSSGRVLGANERIRVGVAGINGRGGSHIDAFAGHPEADVTYLIDPDSRLFDRRSESVKRKGGNTPRTVQDIRQALEDDNLDAVSVATPNHWHSLITIWACQAGKDVYVEKPCSHNVHEGRIAVETARKYDRIVQHGTQSRGSSDWARVMGAIHSGELGKLHVARGLCYKPRGSIGQKPPTAPPKELDFDLWLGPAPEQPHHANLVHYNWHWFWDTGNGDIGNQGVHQMDLARWGIPGAKLPKSVISLGGRFGYEDQGETPNTQIAVYDYGDTQLIFEVRGLKTDDYRGEKVGNIFHLDAGTIVGTRYYPKGSDQPAPLPGESVSRGPGGDVFGNFLACVRSRRREDLHADILEGHYSSALCHLGNLSYRLGSEAPFDGQTKAFGDNKEVHETFERMAEHLQDANDLSLTGRNYRLGRKLVIDADSESIVNDADANRLLTRKYRQPFVVPDSVA